MNRSNFAFKFKLRRYITNNAKKANLQPLDSFFEKVIQLYEMIIVRHGLMIVGYSFGMKSSCISVLAAALGELKEKNQNGEQKVKYWSINPKALTMGQLYGAEDPVSKEWADGILAGAYTRSFQSSTWGSSGHMTHIRAQLEHLRTSGQIHGLTWVHGGQSMLNLSGKGTVSSS